MAIAGLPANSPVPWIFLSIAGWRETGTNRRSREVGRHPRVPGYYLEPLPGEHIAYGNDLFCSEDTGKSAGGPSILDPGNRQWLQETFRTRFATIRELAEQLPKEP
jgi:hypothetical protein